LEVPLGPVRPDRTTMGCRRVERGVTIVLSRPAGRLAPVGRLDLRGRGVPDPQEGTALGRGVVAGQLHRVVGDRRAEVYPPRRVPVVAVGVLVREDVDTAVTDLDRPGI